ncbi:DNRLRE domain-containing protein [Streptomyces cinereoruber]|uniref:DNRLRE domain-containing protein n=1 Tax=Streptomyces cinereoruber TaxID=67260 RepID=UPI003C2E28D9
MPRTAAAAALLLIAEAAFVAGGTAVAAPDGTEAVSSRAPQPSAEEVLASDMAWAAQHAKGSKAWAVLEAKKTGRKVVVTDETTPTAYTVANPDGTLTTELTTGPERIWRDGAWRKVDATLAPTADGSVTAKSHPKGLRLAGRGGTKASSLSAARAATARDLVTLGSGDEAVTLQWKGGLPAPVVNGTTARYPDAVPGADVIVEATRTGFEQFVEIAERPSTADYSYTLPVRAEGLTAKANADGSVSFADARTGEVRATMPAPVMWDASVDQRSGKHENRARVGMKVVDKGRGAVDLVITPDAKFLADPGTTYPVTVDPSTSALGNLFDTYVQQGETVDWSADTELDLGNPGTKNPDGTYRTARSFITWNTAPIADALVSSATLSLWNFHSGNTDCTAQPWEVWTANNASTASRWTNQPAMAAKYATSTATRGNPDCTADGWITADVTTLAQYWAGQKWNAAGMGLRASSESDTLEWKRVNSANNTANQPKLTVTYNYRPSDGTSRQAGTPFKSYAGVWAVNTTTPVLRDTFTDQDGDQVNGTFQVYDAATNTPITTPLGEGLLLSPYGAQGKPVSVTVPAGQLRDGRTYKFRTNAYDGTHYNLNWSPWTQFVVDTTAPVVPASATSSTYPENWGGGSAGTPGTFNVSTGTADANTVQYRVDPYDEDGPNTGWQTVAATSTQTAAFTAAPAQDGNHQIQIRNVDRATNVGPIRDYGFTVGNRDYNRAQKVDIKLPAPNVSAPDPAYLDGPLPAWNWKGWGDQTSRSAQTPALQKREFTSGDMTVTLTPKKQRSLAGTREAAREQQSATALAADYPDPVVTDPWCQPSLYGDAQKSLFTRDEACVFIDARFTAETKVVPGVDPIRYEALFEVAYMVKVDRNGNTIKTWIQWNPISNTFPAEDFAVMLDTADVDDYLVSTCYGSACDGPKSFDWYGDTYWKGGNKAPNQPNDNHMLTGTATHAWNGNVTNAAGTKDVDLSADLPVYFAGMFDTGVEPPPLPGGGKGEWQDQTGPFTSPKVNVRCDKVKTYGTPGCVLKDYVPGYAFNTAKYPAAAAHTWLIQNKSVPNLLLGATPVRPLHFIPGDPARVASGWDKENSRKVMCAKSRSKRTDGWVPNILFLNHPKTFMHPELASTGTPDQVSCDEYPFASTYESPGMPAPDGLNPAGAGGGGECIQTVAAKTDDGTEHLLDDTRYDAPTWAEKCGRSSMSKYVNSGSMERMGVVGNPPFPLGMRLLDKDAFYVDPGNDWFDGCDATLDTVKCEMVKP